MKTTILAVLMVALAGCLTGTGIGVPAADALTGSWSVAERRCRPTLTFAVGGSYEYGLTCKAATGAPAGAQVERGTYTVAEDQIVFTIAQSTCPATTKTYARALTVLDPDTITIGTIDNVKIFARGDASTVAPLQPLGCWDTGSFVPSPLAPL